MRPLTTLLVLVFACGCSSRPTPVRPPEVDPESAATAAMEAYDGDGNGQLDAEELAACPGLLDGMSQSDKNQDGMIDSDEISARLTALYANGVGMLNLGCRVISRGRPVPECTVRLIPESFLGAAVKPAQGTTRESGVAMLRIAPDDLPDGLKTVRGVHSGVYRVEVSHPSSSVTQWIEASSPFGFDVSMADQVQGLTIELDR